MRVLLTGASGHLGAFLLLEAQRRRLDLVAWSGATRRTFAGHNLTPVDLADAEATATAFQEARPDVVLHAAALSAIADCQRQPELAQRLNVDATRRLAELSAQTGAKFVHTSTDLVFDGTKGNYVETDEPRPLSVYAQSKLAGERATLAAPANLAVRIGWLVGPKLLGAPRFFDDVKAKLKAGQKVLLFADEWRSPLGLPTAATALWELAFSSKAGLLHLGGPERLSRSEMGVRLARHLGVDEALVEPIRQVELKTPEPRPADVSLDSGQWRRTFPAAPWATFEATLQELDRIEQP